MKVAFDFSKQVVDKPLSVCVFIFLIVFQTPLTAQETVLDEVIVSSPRIELSMGQQSRSVTTITAKEIAESGANTLIDVLSDVAGIELRSRGAQDVQSDIYIRGGGFDQVLLLIDGIKVDNPQTGHHTLNAILPIEMIERVEILKGAAGRVYGQNAFSGAINIVTKTPSTEDLKVTLSGGSFDYQKAALFATDQRESSSHTLYAETISSDGYRYNTDYYNQNYLWKSSWKTDQEPIELLASFNNRRFGANGFYASPTFTDQFEATQSSLLGLTTSINGNWHIKPKLYWKRGQDEFILFKNDPSIYRNMHITNKLGAEVNATKKHALGTTGIGFELAHVSIRSNNLGEHARTLAHGYLEHRFVSNRWDVTPGFSVSHYTDQDTFFYPGIDIGFQINGDSRLFFNSGYTYRIPTYTDLYYNDPTTLGNESLLPEKALSTELGFRHRQNNWKLSISLFQRDAKNYIDYVVLAGEERWQATNIDQILSQGGELDVVLNSNSHKFSVGYAYLKDDVDGVSSALSRYAINSRKHHLSTRWTLRWNSLITSSISYRYAEQDSGYHYNVVDANMAVVKGRVKLSLSAHNILNADYTEQNLVPMPKGHALLSLQYQFY
ncbi:MAG: TonB-dependent receptor [Flavobacteriaceae bacterium]|nr:TonB-dependent receptor [Flavobacteriaceae bacterium]|tara:strand:+ start:15483 stop:17309 length:1827 start_codon:yes stop_codon:yes gene_type:complete